MSNTSHQKNRVTEWIRRVVLNNWPSKLLSLVLALLLWTFLITQDETLTREREFTNVPINVVGLDSIKRNGYIVVSDLNDLPRVNLIADVPQGVYWDATEANYNVRIDLSRISSAGEQAVRVVTTSSGAYGKARVTANETVTLNVEEYKTRNRIVATMDNHGELPDGFVLSSSALNPTVISVSGPKSLVDSVVRAEAIVDLSEKEPKEGTTSTNVPFRLLDEHGEEVYSPLLTVSTTDGTVIDSMIVTHSLVSKRTLPVSDTGLWSGMPADGYQVLSVSVEPSEIDVTGLLKDLENLKYLSATQTVDVTNMTGTVVETLRIHKPTEVNTIKPDSVTVQVEIGPMMMSRTFSELPIKVTNVRSGLEARYGNITGYVTITGPTDVIRALKKEDVELLCNAGNLYAGTYPMPVLCRVAESTGKETFDVGPEAIMVELVPVESND